MTRIAAIGEAMVELTHQDERTLALNYAGDTLNTATYLARLSGPEIQVDYVTRVGNDWYSSQLVSWIGSEGLGSALIDRVEGGTPGLYLIRTAANGERRFTYHRSESPARGLFGPDHDPEVAEALQAYDLVYLSAITLQILSPEARGRLWQALDGVRRCGGKVAFDSNYRPAGWASADEARSAITTTLERTDWAFPTFDDEQVLFGDANPDSCARRILESGVGEVAVKTGACGCLVRTNSLKQTVPAEYVPEVVDTTGAGDSFNAGYLAARIRGEAPGAAARAGHQLAAKVIQWPGAIIPTTGHTRSSRAVAP